MESEKFIESSNETSAIPSDDPIPPEVPLSKIPTWFYRPTDLLGIGFVYVLFFGLVINTVRISGEQEIVLGVRELVTTIGFQFASAAVVTFFVIFRIRPVEWLGLKWKNWPYAFAIAPIAVVSMWLFFGLLQVTGYMKWMESLGLDSVQDTVKLLQEAKDPMILALMAGAAVIAAPICEEIIFRGYFYPASKRFIGRSAAVVVSALVFASAHGNLAALLPLFVFGCMLAMIYEKTGSIWAPIAVHFCFNGATVALQMAARYHGIPLDDSL